MNNAELKAHLSSLPQPALYVLCPPLSSKFRATDTVVTYWQWGADNCARHTKLFFHMRTENIQSVREEFRQQILSVPLSWMLPRLGALTERRPTW